MKKIFLLCLVGMFFSACAHSPAEPGRVGQMYFSTISFALNGTDIKKSSYKFLDEAAKVYKRNPAVTVEVRGYTDATGSEYGNLNLSKQRAETVSEALQARGVPADHIKAVGYGPGKPVASNHTAEGRQQNRRVEIEFPYPGTDL